MKMRRQIAPGESVPAVRESAILIRLALSAVFIAAMGDAWLHT